MDRFALLCLLLASVAGNARGEWPFSPTPRPNLRPEMVVTHPRMEEILEVSDTETPRVFRRHLTISGGNEFGWLQPRFSNNVSASITGTGGNDVTAFRHDHELTSRVWLGIENRRRNGVRARYWYLDTEAPTQVTFATAGASPASLTIEGAGGNLSRTAVANLGDVLTSDHRFEVRTIDLEATHRMLWTCNEALVAFGLRFGKSQQRAHAVATDGTGSLTELVCQDIDFRGFGPTLAIDYQRWLIHTRLLCSRLSCFANTRGSMLFGKQNQEIVLVTGGGAGLAEDYHQHDDFAPILELAGGLQWTAKPFGRAALTLRTGYRAETWFGVGGPVDAISDIALHGVLFSLGLQI